MSGQGDEFLCAICGKPVGDKRWNACDHCGAPFPYTFDEYHSTGRLFGSHFRWPLWWVRLQWLTVGVLIAAFGVVLVGAYAVSEEGQARLLELVLLVVGPLLIVGLAWVGYRAWYRRRYPDG